MRSERTVTLADKNRSRLATGLLVAAAVAPCWACTLGAYNLLAAPRETLTFACRNTPTFSDEPDLDVVTYEGRLHDRSMMAVLVVPRLTHRWWTLRVTAVDSRSMTGECRPATTEASEEKADSGPDPRSGECLRVATPTGSRSLRLLATSKPVGESWEADYLRGGHVEGSATFVAKPNGLYSVQVCAPGDRKTPLFWVRDERTNSCVSAACPVLEED
jgi:hypothetical protein